MNLKPAPSRQAPLLSARTGIFGFGAIAAVLLVLTGCGGGSSTAAESQLQAERKAGEEVAHERDRVNSLQKQVDKLRHQVKQGVSSPSSSGDEGSASPATPPAEPSGEVMRAFHVASGNVSCEILADGATCTVEPIAQTFTFEGGEPARMEPGAALAQDIGELVPYGSTVSVGSVTCEVPPSSVPRGITCSDSSSGHGFEASRVTSRQSVY